jgi:threonine aldolase
MRQAMASQLAMSLLTEPGDEILCDEWGHIRNYELGAASYFSTGRRDT